MTRSTSSSKIQAIYELCKKSFTSSESPLPCSQSINSLSCLLDTLPPVDVGMKETAEDDRGYGVSFLNLFNRAARWSQSITYVDAHECDSFMMCIFCFPTSAVIPLHDHPDMTVFSKVLYGSLHIKANDWVEPPVFRTIKHQNSSRVRLAKLAADQVLTASSGTSVLFPKTGGTDDESGAELAWPKEVRELDNLYMQSGNKGPAVRIWQPFCVALKFLVNVCCKVHVFINCQRLPFITGYGKEIALILDLLNREIAD
ncbi:Plant cysteine oxidase 3-like protein [Drosera capensis]